MCKQFVTGRKCDTCKEGSSSLDPDNPFGCSKGECMILSVVTNKNFYVAFA